MRDDNPIQRFCDQRRVTIVSDTALNADTLDAWRKSPPAVRNGVITVPSEQNLATGQFLAGITESGIRHAVEGFVTLQKRLPPASSRAAASREFFASLPAAVQERMLQSSTPTDGTHPDHASLRAARDAGIDYRNLNPEQRRCMETMLLAASARWLFAGLALWKRFQRAIDRGDLRLSTITGKSIFDIVHIADDERWLTGIPLLMAPIDRWEGLDTGGVSLVPATPDPPDLPPGMTRPSSTPSAQRCRRRSRGSGKHCFEGR